MLFVIFLDGWYDSGWSSTGCRYFCCMGLKLLVVISNSQSLVVLGSVVIRVYGAKWRVSMGYVAATSSK